MKNNNLVYQGLTEYNNELRVTWTIVSLCNYKCEYCIKPMPTIKFVSKKDIYRIIMNLKKLGFLKYNIVITGGEPTLHPNLLYIIDFLNKTLNCDIKIITNGSSSLEKYKALLDIGVKLDVSVHYKYYSNYRIEEIIELQKYSHQVTIMLMFYPFYFTEIKYMHGVIIRKYLNNINYDLVMLRKPPIFDTIIDYTEENIKWYNDNKHYINVQLNNIEFNYSTEKKIFNTNYSNLMLVPDLLNFENMYCISSFNVIQIFVDNHFTGTLCNFDSISSNFLHTTKLTPKIVCCDKHSCLCSTNLQIPKFHKKEEAVNFLSRNGFNE